MKAKYKSICPICSESINKGHEIRKTGRGTFAHQACIEGAEDDEQAAAFADDEHEDPERTWPPSPSVLATDRRLARQGLHVTRFSSGAVMTRNARGRCEDAPCCGCCS